MNEALQSWINQTAAHPAVIACGVRTADRATHAKTFRRGVAETHITQALREISEALFALQQNRLPAERLRWVFEEGQIHCVTAPGGALVVLVLGKAALPEAEITRLLASCPLGSS